MTQPMSVPETGPRLNPEADRPITEILKDLFEHTQQLAKQELKLAGAELDEKIAKTKADLLAPVLGGVVAHGGALCLLAALILGLSEIMPPWAAAAVVGVLTTAIGFVLIKRASAPDPEFKRVPPNVHADVQTFKEAIK
jgi:type IV secretory pathway TrbD component